MIDEYLLQRWSKPVALQYLEELCKLGAMTTAHNKQLTGCDTWVVAQLHKQYHMTYKLTKLGQTDLFVGL